MQSFKMCVQPVKQRDAACSRSLVYSSAPQTTSVGNPMPRSCAQLVANSATCGAASGPTMATARRASSSLTPGRTCCCAASVNACTRARTVSLAALCPVAPARRASASATMRRSYSTSNATGGSPGGAGGASSRNRRTCAGRRQASHEASAPRQASATPAPHRRRRPVLRNKRAPRGRPGQHSGRRCDERRGGPANSEQAQRRSFVHAKGWEGRRRLGAAPSAHVVRRTTMLAGRVLSGHVRRRAAVTRPRSAAVSPAN